MKKWLGNLKLAKKLLVSPFVAIIFLLIFGIVSYAGFFRQKAALDDIYNNRLVHVQIAADTLIDMKEVHSNLMDVFRMFETGQERPGTTKSPGAGRPTDGESSQRDDAAQGTAEKLRLIDETRTTQAGTLDKVLKGIEGILRSNLSIKEEKTGFIAVQEKVKLYRDMTSKIFDAAEKEPALLEPLRIETEALFTDIDGLVRQLFDMQRKLSKNQHGSAELTFRLVLVSCFVVLLAAIAFPFALGLLMKSEILNPIKKTVDTIESVAQGDLTRRIDVTSSDEIGEMARHFNSFVDGLHDIMTRVTQGSDEVSSAAHSLDTSSKEMAADMEEVALRVGSLATAGEEMSATTSTIAHNCVEAAKGSESAGDSAKTGKAIIEETITIMNFLSNGVTESASVIRKLGQSSDQIGAIVDLINDIADQTNLLALNAAIEAARAGEYGRGFAVVAGEVKKLAERTGSATKEIADTINAMQIETRKAVASIEEGVAGVKKGTTNAARSGEALSEILRQIRTVNAEINQIAVASEEEATTTDEIATSIQQVSSVMQQTTTKIQGNADASRQLAALSRDLQKMVSRFNL